jgi:hypothetical protein
MHFLNLYMQNDLFIKLIAVLKLSILKLKLSMQSFNDFKFEITRCVPSFFGLVKMCVTN